MFLAINPPASVLADVNRHLTNFYSVLVKTPHELTQALEMFKSKFDALAPATQKELFYAARTEFNQQDSSPSNENYSEESVLLRAHNFYILNKLGFNGLYRENSSGDFNVPFSGRKSFPSIDRENFMEVAARFINSELITGDFLSIVEHSREGDFVYFDPPYIPLTPTASFTSYSKLGFGLAEQERLAEAMRNLTNRGVKVMMSNSDTAVTRRIFSDFDLVTIEAPRVISSKSSTRGKVSEVVARNY
jgi:DNA adenine methylase